MNDDQEEYVVRVAGPKYRWMWFLLLLLLPLLLLLRFSKDITVVAYDNFSNNNLSNVKVGLKFVDYSIVKTNPLRFFVADSVNLSGVTSQDGEVAFTDVNYSLYQVIFHSGHEAEITAEGGCLASDTVRTLFSTLGTALPYRLGLNKARVDLVFLVLDSDDRQPLASADVEVMVDGNVKKLLTDPSGYVSVPGMELCGNVDINAQMDGYLGDTIVSDMETALQGEHNRTLLLKPGRGVVSFTVQDLENQLPIPNVAVSMMIDGNTVNCVTNTNGVGKGCFEDVKANLQFQLDLKRVSYFDTLTQQYKVSGFERLSERERTFQMRPQKNSLIFRNIDSLNNLPISGVANEVFINGNPVGTIYSNAQGCFTIGNVAPGDEILIKSTHVNYKFQQVKRSGSDVIGNNQYKRDVKMQAKRFAASKPNPQRNCGVHFSGTLLSDVAVGGHISKIYEPDKYGEYVGDGKYANNQAAFPKAVQYTFDAIAVDKGTRLKVYSKPNFQGELLLDVKGPYLINNVKWKNEPRISNFLTKTFSPELEANYPPSCRHWSESNMNDWDYGSVIITCDK